MFEININVAAPELATAIESLAAAMGLQTNRIAQAPATLPASTVTVPAPEFAPVQTSQTAAPVPSVPVSPVSSPAPGPVAPIPTAPAPVAPTPTPAPVPVAPAPAPAPAPVPTAPAPTYDLPTLARACSVLVDAGRVNEVQELMAQFGVNRLDALPQAQYGAFATALRSKGVTI